MLTTSETDDVNNVLVQWLSHVQFFCDPMDCSMPGFPVLHNLPEFAQPHEVVIPSNRLILCCSFFFLSSIFPSIRVFPNELALCIRWPECWSFSFSISSSNEYSGLISFKIDWFVSLLPKGLSGVISSNKVQRHQFFGTLPSSSSSSHKPIWPLGRQ